MPILWPVLVICGLILPADFSTATMLLIVCFTMIFIGGAKIKHLVSIVGTAVVGFLFLILLNMAFPGLLPRVDTWEKRMMSYGSGDKQENYQAEMAKRAVANGFLFGKGPGRGHVKMIYILLNQTSFMLPLLKNLIYFCGMVYFFYI